MKTNLILSILLITCFTVGCDKEDDDSSNPSTQNSNNGSNNGNNTNNDNGSGNTSDTTDYYLGIDGNSILLKDGKIKDKGKSYYENHIIYNFAVSDEVVGIHTSGTFMPPSTYEIYCWAQLYSADTTGFEPGTYKFIQSDSLNYPNTAIGRNVYREAFVVIDGGTPNIERYEATGGTITVSGTNASEYVVNYDLDLDNGSKLTGSYGNFTIH